MKDVTTKEDNEDKLTQAIMQTKLIKIYSFHNLNLKTNLGSTSTKNPLRDKLVKPAYKFVKSVAKTSSKVQEHKTFNKVINNFIYENKQCETVNEELSNLNVYQTWYYTLLSDNQKPIDCK